MTMRCRVSPAGMKVAAAAALLLTGCATMTSSQEELQSMGANEGIVIGSVLITVAQAAASESGLAFLKGRKADELEYSLTVTKSEPGIDLLKPTYFLPATPGKEAHFVRRLPAGSYGVRRIEPTGFLAPKGLAFGLAWEFEVKPQQVSYVGRLVVALPHRVGFDSRIGHSVEDAQQDAAEKLKGEYSSIVANAVKSLPPEGSYVRPHRSLTIAQQGGAPVEQNAVRAGEAYRSPGGLFSLPAPKTSNPFGVPYSVTALDTQGDNLYEKILFHAGDFGEFLVIGVRTMPAISVSLMDKDDHRTVLRNVSQVSLMGWRTDLDTLPDVIEESFSDSGYGEAISRLYRAKKGSMLVSSQGRRPTRDDAFDAIIASIVARRGSLVVFVLAQNDSSPGNSVLVARMADAAFRALKVSAAQ